MHVVFSQKSRYSSCIGGESLSYDRLLSLHMSGLELQYNTSQLAKH